jgi:signal transduction histidine kinase
LSKEDPEDKAAARQLEEITETLMSYAQLDFSRAPKVIANGPLDAVAAGLIALGDELQAALAVRDVTEENKGGKQRFLAMMSHELRTPLSTIIGSAEMLAVSNLDSNQAAQLQRITTASRLLQRSIDDVLDFSDLQTGTIAIQEDRFDLPALLSAVIAQFDDRAKDRGLDLSLDSTLRPGLLLMGDSKRILQVLKNLLDNAIKFCPKGAVRLNVRESAVGEYCFVVQDTGVGIPSADHKRIFEGFSSGDESLRRRHHGLGLGLGIVKALVAAMNGRVSVHSRVGAGSRFEVVLPLASAEKVAQKKAVGEEKGLCGIKRVLVVDDTALVCEVAVEMLTALGCHVDAVSSGHLAIERLANGAVYDVILMDCQMPGLDGLQTCRHLLKAHPDADFRIVAISAHASDAELAKQSAAGMVEHVPKPFRLAELKAVLDRV